MIITLCGFMGCGKSTLGRGLAQACGCRFIDLDDYIAEMNAVLNECGFSELYMGNPFDWMFLYCTLEDNPLDTFRGLLAEALDLDN